MLCNDGDKGEGQKSGGIWMDGCRMKPALKAEGESSLQNLWEI